MGSGRVVGPDHVLLGPRRVGVVVLQPSVGTFIKREHGGRRGAGRRVVLTQTGGAGLPTELAPLSQMDDGEDSIDVQPAVLAVADELRREGVLVGAVAAVTRRGARLGHRHQEFHRRAGRAARVDEVQPQNVKADGQRSGAVVVLVGSFALRPRGTDNRRG